MFYEPSKGHGLPHDPFKAIVAPRPIGWISSLAADGTLNLAPYSYFNGISTNPHLVMFSSEGPKDSASNVRETREFVVNLATRDLIDKVNESSVDAPRHVSEFEYAGLTPAPSVLVKPPRVAEAHAALECKVVDIYEPKGLDGRHAGVFMIIGECVGVYVDEKVLTDGRFDIVKAGTTARLGYRDYASVTETFEMVRPRWKS